MRALLMTFVSALLFLCFALGDAPVAAANVEDFSYDSWDSDIELRVDEDGRATAHVTETLVTRFPEVDQNKGIVRGLPVDLQGADAAPQNISVTDASGNPTPFFTEEDDDFLVILTGDDSYVQGVQTYVISYDIPDPIVQPRNADIDEFYWDVVSVDRLQPIERFTAQVSVDPQLEAAFMGAASAYIGEAGSSDTIPVTHEGGSFTIEPVALGPDETVTVALGFDPATVVQPRARIPHFTLDTLPVILSGAALAVAGSALFAVGAMKRRRRRTDRAVIAQYDVPAHLPPLIAAQLQYPAVPDAIAPQFLHLAVSGHMRIEERLKADGSLHKKPRPVFRNLAPSVPNDQRAVDPLDAAALNAIFTAQHPEHFAVPSSSTSFAKRMTQLVAQARTASDERGYFTKARSRAATALGLAALGLVVVSAVIAGVAFFTGFAKDFTAVTIVLCFVALPLIFLAAMKHRVHTATGAEAYEYLQGVKLFIEIAEADRIKMLQSPTGAERFAENGVEVVKLYERLLPYAALFKLEQEWAKVLQTRYEAEQITTPYWYPYLATRGLSSLGDSVTNLTGRVSSAASYTQSTSSGSSGGGFAGGGGGGGFSGGR